VVDDQIRAVGRRLGRWVLSVLLGVSAGVVFASAGDLTAGTSEPSALGQEQPWSGAGGEASGPRLVFRHEGSTVTQALQLGSHLDIQIAGLLAQARLTQHFINTGSEWAEAEYLFPLPPDGAVTQLEIEVGERIIRGEIKEREEAHAVYDAARRAGKRSALLEQQRPNLFTTRVANIPPGEEIIVHVDLVLPVRYRDGEFSLRFPTTVTAPFIPGLPRPSEQERPAPGDSWLPLSGSGWSLPTSVVPDAPLITAPQTVTSGGDPEPENPLSLAVTLRPGIPLAHVGARYHELNIDRVTDGFDLSFPNGVVEMDRDVVLSWKPQRRHRPQAAVFRERFDGEEFALLMLLPPVEELASSALRRELLLVLDVSGSMQGEPIRQAKASVLHALDTLGSDDYFNLIVFNDQYASLFPEAQPAKARSLEQARSFVRSLRAGGGTQMLPALSVALNAGVSADEEGDRLRQLIFVTDGAVGNEQQLLNLLEQDQSDARIFTVGIGSAPNSYFMEAAAIAGRGIAVFIARPDEVAPRMMALFERIERPQMAGVQVHWSGGAEAYPFPVPDLYAGEPVLQVAKLDEVVAGASITVQGRQGDRAWEQHLTLPEATDSAGVASHWARQKLAAILRDGRRGQAREEVRAKALPLALRFSLASPFTSFVAVEEVPQRPLEATPQREKLPNVVPQGQSPQRFALAQGATEGPFKVLLATLLACSALVLRFLHRGALWI